MLPFQKNQPNQATTTPTQPPAPALAKVQPTTPAFNPFAAVDEAKTFENGAPEPEHGDYLVKLTKVIFKQDKLLIIWECEIVGYVGEESGSHIGAACNSVRSMNTQGWESYYARDVLAAIGLPATGEQSNQAKRYVSTLTMAAITGQPTTAPDGTVIQPEELLGKVFRCVVSQGKDDKKGIYRPKKDFKPYVAE